MNDRSEFELEARGFGRLRFITNDKMFLIVFFTIVFIVVVGGVIYFVFFREVMPNPGPSPITCWQKYLEHKDLDLYLKCENG